jgi:phosphoglucosamine mutase
MTNDLIGRHVPCDELLEEYIDFLVKKASPKVKDLKVYIDCSNGSSSFIAPEVLKRLGVNYTVVAHEPNGLNINDRCGSTKIENNSETVASGRYDVAFAFDGDADRCLAMTSEGKVIDGDQLIYLNALYLKKNGKLSGNTVVITVMSNLGLKKALAAEGLDYHETKVGDKYVQMDMKANHLSIGGEQSGHIIFLDDLNTGDGVLTMIHTLNVIASEGKSLQELVKNLKIYPQSLKNVVVTNKEAILSLEGFKAKVAELEKSLKGNGRILVRPSGTEPKIRVMCEAPTQEQCDEITTVLANYVEDISQ